MTTTRTRLRPSALPGILAAIASAAFFLASCRTLPPASDPNYQRMEREAREALPYEAALFLAMEPRAFPELKKAVLAGLPAREASALSSILKTTRMAYAAYTPPWGPGAEGAHCWYALLSGGYSSATIKAGLAGSKGVKKAGDWYELASGIKIALDGDRRILATNADMRSFLDRLREPSLRLERAQQGEHPVSMAAEARSLGARLLAPRPGQSLLSPLAGAASGLPMDYLALDVEETGGEERIDAEFAFQGENGAKAFSPAVRVILAAVARIFGLPGPLPELRREGPRLLAPGIAAKPEAFAALLFSMAGKAK